MLNRSLVRDPARGPYCQVITCETAPKRDPGQDSSKLLKSSPKTPEVYVPIGADRDPTRNKNLLQCIKELRPIRGGDRFGVDSQPRSRTPRSSSTARSLASSLTRFSAKTSQRQADKKRTGARHVGHLLRKTHGLFVQVSQPVTSVASGGGNGLIPRSNASCTRSIIVRPVRRSTEASGYRARKSTTTGLTNRTMPFWQ